MIKTKCLILLSPVAVAVVVVVVVVFGGLQPAAINTAIIAQTNSDLPKVNHFFASIDFNFLFVIREKISLRIYFSLRYYYR
jgi:hypothetical protein